VENFFVRHKSPLAVTAFILIIAGVFAYTKMQTSLFPEITFPKIKIIADNGLQPVNKMMITVTKPIEQALKQVPDLVTLRSITSRGSCEISAFLHWGSDIDMGKQRIESAINEIRADLPPGVGITVEKMNPSILPILGYSIEDTVRSSIELDLIATTQIVPYISQAQGVAAVRSMGGKKKEYWIEPNQQKMVMLALDIDTVFQVLQHNNFIMANGYFSDYRRLYLSVTDASLTSLADLSNLVIRNDGRRVTYLKDIADIVVHEEQQYIRINSNGKSAVLVNILKQPNANLISVTDEVKQKVAELNSGLLPKGMKLVPYYVQAEFVNDSIGSVRDSLMVGLLLAILVSIIFLRSLRSSAVILITIPITVALALLVIHAVGYTFNIMTLGALAASIGLIIDDAIVVTEQIHRTHEEHPEEDPATFVQQAIAFLMPAMIGSSLSTIVIFIPFILMSGVAGAYFSVLTTTMILTLVCSFVVTWIFLPIVYLFIAKPHSAKKASVTDNRSRWRWVDFCIHHPFISVGFTIICIGIIVFVPPLLQTGFLPDMDEGAIVLDYSSPPGTSLDETDRMLRDVESRIVKIPEVQSYSRRTGTQMGFYITEPNRGDYLIQLKKDRNRTTDDVIDEIRKEIEASQPALRIDFGQVIGDMLGDLMSSVQPIEVKLFGSDRKKFAELSDTISKIIEHIPGTADVFRGITISGPSVNVLPDYQKLAQYKLSPDNFQQQLQSILQGVQTGSIYEHELQTSIRLIYPRAPYVSEKGLENAQIFISTGSLIPLEAVANVSVNEGDAEIERENLQSMVAITGRLDNRDLGSVMTDIKQQITRSIALPQGYHITYGGAYAEQQKSFQELLMILLLSGLLVFTTILFLFKDLRIALLILFMAALGISGSLLGLLITHTPLNVGSYTGLIMMVGIIGENAIFTYLQFRDALKTHTVDESVVYAISTRLRPKLMTALGAIFALAPIALGIGAGSQLHQPLAIAVIGGFIFALPILLVVLPSFLRIIEVRREKKRILPGGDGNTVIQNSLAP
jgi:CzcA family heavy metal efflux pump